jgi:arginine utilization regulatory protein
MITVNEDNIIESATKGFKKIIGNNSFINESFEDVFDIKVDEILKVNKIINIRNKKILASAYAFDKINDRKKLIVLKDISIIEESEKIIYCYEEIFSKLNDGLVMSDREGKITLYNEAQEKLEGLSSKDSVGKHLWEVYNYSSPESSEHRQVFKTGVPVISEYKSHIQGKNVEKYVAYSTYPIIKNDETLAVFSISENESKLMDLLSETIDLKRQIKGSSNQVYQDNGTTFNFDDIKGSGDNIKKTLREAQQLSLMKGNLLIIGETGVGKEMFAQSIHNISNSKEKFFAMNCAALPENLFESTLFGTTKGSFTGSVDQNGYFDTVGKGTLFLDELNSMPMYMQTKLLRVLQEKRFRKVGGMESRSIECRIICAINEDPEKLMNEGRLRTDLFYRISRLCLLIPPLRERKEDISFLTTYFINKYNGILNKNVDETRNELKELLFEYRWPGNVRELEHVIENLVMSVGNNEKRLESGHLPSFLKNKILKDKSTDKKNLNSLPNTLNEIERKLIIESLNKYKWNITKSAEHLGIIRQSLIYRIKKLDIIKENDC